VRRAALDRCPAAARGHRNRRFSSLTELNAAIRELLDRLNDRVTRHLGASRRQLFEQIEKPALRPLPAEPYVFAEWKQRTGCPARGAPHGGGLP